MLLRGLLAGLLMCSTVILSACNAASWTEGGADSPVAPAYQSPYDPEELVQTDGRFEYRQYGQVVSRTGIDVSSHQGDIDWEAVASDGIDFAFIRIGYRGYTEGQIFTDEYFEKNFREARAAGLLVGVYFFSQALNEEEAHEEALFVLEALARLQALDGSALNGDSDGERLGLDYPVVYDFESVSDPNGRGNAVSAAQRTKNALLFSKLIAEAGFTPMIYGNARDLRQYHLNTLGSYDFWFAEYDTAFPTGQLDFTIWQYTSSGSVAGIATSVDMNIDFLGTLSAREKALQKLGAKRLPIGVQ